MYHRPRPVDKSVAPPPVAEPTDVRLDDRRPTLEFAERLRLSDEEQRLPSRQGPAARRNRHHVAVGGHDGDNGAGHGRDTVPVELASTLDTDDAHRLVGRPKRRCELPVRAGAGRQRDQVIAPVGVESLGVAALVSILTGINRIVAPPGNRLPFVALLPVEATMLAGVTGAITGFLLLIAAYGLKRRLRVGWYAALVLLPLTALQGLVGSTTIGLLLAFVSVVALLALALDRSPFSERVDRTPTQWAAIACLVGSLGYSTAGAYALKDDFSNIATIMDAVYFSVVTASTVGYGDVTPVPGTTVAKWFTMLALVLNVAAFAVALGVLFTPAIEARPTTALGRMTDSDIDLLADHVLVLGHGELTEPPIDELLAAGAPFLVITPDEARA
jgi:voltage-gated potassium channel